MGALGEGGGSVGVFPLWQGPFRGGPAGYGAYATTVGWAGARRDGPKVLDSPLEKRYITRPIQRRAGPVVVLALALLRLSARYSVPIVAYAVAAGVPCEGRQLCATLQ